MKNMNAIFSVVLLLILSIGCTKVLDIELEEGDQMLIVDAEFSTYPRVHEVKLSFSSSFSNNSAPQKAIGAKVTVTDGTNVFEYFDKGNGLYQTDSNAFGEPEKEYTLTIEYNGKSYTAKDYCDASPNLDTVIVELLNEADTVVELDSVISVPRTHELRFSMQEKPGGIDYYSWQIFKNGVHLNNEIPDFIAQSDEFFPDGIYFDEIPLEVLTNLEAGDRIEIAQHAISPKTFDIYNAILFQTEFRGFIFDSPPANVPTNLSEGATGLFTATGESRNYTIVQ